MEKHLYHGSDRIIESPIFGGGRQYNDYGPGFYCTENQNMAKEWAAGPQRDGFANSYILNCMGLSLLNLNSGDYTVLHWLAVLLENREFDAPSALAKEAKEYLKEYFVPEYREADIIIGYRADDSYFSFAQDFINGTISYRQLNRAMHLGNLGEQIVLKSRNAFEQIRFTGAEKVRYEEWYEKKMQRDKLARRKYFDTRENRRQKGDIYITHILEEEMKADDARLR